VSDQSVGAPTGGMTVLLAAGGTGGHLFPAQALAEVLNARGATVHLATDHRVEKYGQAFPAVAVHEIPSATVTGRSPVALAKTSLTLANGIRRAHGLLGRIKPDVVVGFGGYPSFPPLSAALIKGIPTALHEQNAVLGRANKMLAPRVTALATSFPDVKFTEGLPAGKVRLTGNPVRASVLVARDTPYATETPHGRVQLLVFGGSQGARYFSDTVPEAVALLSASQRARLKVVQQCRDEDLERVQDRYGALGITAECAAFFQDLPQRIADSQLVIGRAGASTIAEITVIGRPSILVPLPHALDNDQLQNATRLAKAGGSWLFEQRDLTIDRLADHLADLLGEPDRLSQAAQAARGMGRPDAHEALADLVEEIALAA
jgi:UDP-N-acetylglucosamine--N-acetylmuramyl-(pentapeptide) pyrophosphoryl-undecaprenol N-acetylglucosamine transferase